ncbi:MAG: AEC family transporter [Ruminococcaceae bacterium]|nr:AEC family transporter [Oscillospiraceae bacterium]
MLDSILFSLNSVAPIFILTLIGVILGRKKFLNDGFLAAADKLVFKICLPCLLFVDIATADLGERMDMNLLAFCIIAVILSFFIPCLVVPLFIKDNPKRGAFIQGIYRANTAIIGIVLAENMFGAEGRSTMALVLPFVVALFNAFAVVILSIYAPADVKLTPKQLVKRISKSVVTNPLIIGIILGLLWQLTGLTLPLLAERSLDYLSGMATPLALISLGATFRLESLKGRLGLTLLASAIKTAILPAVCCIAAILLGFRGVALGVVFIQFGSPASVSSYIMAKQMKSDHELAGQIMLVSTLMSVFTMFAGTFLLRMLGYI